MEARPKDTAIEIRLLGRFEVVVGDRVVNGASSWPSTRSAQLVQLLALADGHALTREQVIDALWPHLDVDAGAANLRKAAHHARRALGADDAVVLRRGQVALFPGRPVDIDVERFERAVEAALASTDAEAWQTPAEWYSGDLLPESLYEEWTQGAASGAAGPLRGGAASRPAVGAAGRARAGRRARASGTDAGGAGRRRPPRRRPVVRASAHGAAAGCGHAARLRDRGPVRRVCGRARRSRADVRRSAARAGPRLGRVRGWTRIAAIAALGSRPGGHREVELLRRAGEGRGPRRLAVGRDAREPAARPRTRGWPHWSSG